MNRPGPFDGEKIHILAEKCSTCVFRAGNKMHLEEGRLADLVQANLDADGAITCHQTLTYNHEYDAEPAVCRGFYDGYGKEVTALRVATAFGAITEDPSPTPRKKETA